MLFAVIFEDHAERAEEIRRRHMQLHLDFLQQNGSAIKAAGPLRDEDGVPAGGLWLVEATGRDLVEQLVRADPFWRAGLRRLARVLVWKQVFADGVRRAVEG